MNSVSQAMSLFDTLKNLMPLALDNKYLLTLYGTYSALHIHHRLYYCGSQHLDQGFSNVFPHAPHIFIAAPVFHLQFPETLLYFITHAQAQFRVSLEYELTLY